MPVPEHPPPSLSVVVPVHNRPWALRRALCSVLAQQGATFEVVVVDDGSTEDVASVITEFDDNRVRFARQEQRGANAARNRGAAEASARLLTFLDADDEVLPGWAATLAGALASGAEIVCCGFERIEADGTTTRRLPGPLGGPLGNVEGKFGHAGTYALHSEVFQAVGGFAATLRAAQHTELAYRLVPLAVDRGWRIVNILRPLLRYHVGMEGGVRGDHVAVLQGAEYLLREHAALLRTCPETRATSHGIAGYRAARLNQYERARAHFRDAVRANPRAAKAWARYGLSCLPPLARRVWEPEGRRRTSGGASVLRHRGPT